MANHLSEKDKNLLDLHIKHRTLLSCVKKQEELIQVLQKQKVFYTEFFFSISGIVFKKAT